MRLGFDARHWRQTGIGRYVRNLVPALPAALAARWPDATVVAWVHAADLADARARAPGIDWRACDAPLFSLAEQRFWHRTWREARLDLFHAPHLNAPWRVPCPWVVTIHDLTPLRFPGTITRPGGLPYFRWAAGRAARGATRIVTPSAATADHVAATFGVARDRVGVTPLAADAHFFTPQPRAARAAVRMALGLGDQPYVLYVGQWKRYKNVTGLLEAFAALGRPEVSLVLAGRRDPRSPHVPAAIAALGLGGRVVYADGHADDASFAALYQEAAMLAFPSRAEGFGLPPLEAMAAGTPVITSGAPPMPAIAGDAALIVSPDDTAGWTLAMATLLDDGAERERLIARGRARAAEFSWAATAAATVEAYAAGIAPTAWQADR